MIHSNSQSKTTEQAGSPGVCAERVGGGLEARVEGLGHGKAGSAELGLSGVSVEVGSVTEFVELIVQVNGCLKEGTSSENLQELRACQTLSLSS